MACEKCPCSDSCLQWPAFCEWAAEDPPDEVKIRTIRERSARGPNPGPIPSPYPSLATMAGNALAAAGRVVAAAATGGPIRVPPPVYYERPGPGR